MNGFVAYSEKETSPTADKALSVALTSAPRKPARCFVGSGGFAVISRFTNFRVGFALFSAGDVPIRDLWL